MTIYRSELGSSSSIGFLFAFSFFFSLLVSLYTLFALVKSSMGCLLMLSHNPHSAIYLHLTLHPMPIPTCCRVRFHLTYLIAVPQGQRENERKWSEWRDVTWKGLMPTKIRNYFIEKELALRFILLNDQFISHTRHDANALTSSCIYQIKSIFDQNIIHYLD